MRSTSRILLPPPDRNAGQWGDEERREPAFAAYGGRWSTDVAPYWWPVLEAIHDRRTRQVTVVASSQSGKTANVILNVIGHRFMDGPRVPTLVVLPTQQLAKDMSNDRVRRLINTTPALNELHAKGKKDGTYEKWIAGVPLRFAWSGSNTALASHPSGLALVDELDRMRADNTEGSVLVRVRVRLLTYPNRQLIVCSSPTIQDSSDIQDEFDAGTMEIAEWPCPHCGEYARPQSMFLRWEKGADPAAAAASAVYVCEVCGGEASDDDKLSMMRAYRYQRYKKGSDGRYVRREEQAIEDYGHRSFWVSGLLAPWEGASFAELARELCSAYRSQDPETIKATINTNFGELWAVRGERPPLEDVLKCRAAYRCREKPYGVQRCTMGVDVQQDRLVWIWCGFGAERAPEECWVLDYGEIMGNPTFDDVWIELRRYLTDVEMEITLCLVDSGWKPGLNFLRPDHRIYSFCRRSGGLAFPCKGFRKRPTPVASHLHDVEEGGRKIKNGTRLHNIDVTHFKTKIYSRLAPEQEDDQRCFHLPVDCSEDFMRQVIAEELIVKASGEPYYDCPRGRPNHYLDALVYACAANTMQENKRRLKPLKKRPRREQEEPAPARTLNTPPRFQRRGIV